ncbi:MAG: D-alanyl-D-alanine carboxypeptidase/D-alanyl-D-alanine-endopeptidase [Acidobacteria bacterium]|nr:MAG: D-alanyl-D-alanine carboxypeptidase/D-alanyl-D-alanine-endopeptidase [Acidobacteriota bacterium]
MPRRVGRVFRPGSLADVKGRPTRNTVAGALLLLLFGSACAAHKGPTSNPRAERELASDLTRVFGAPVMSQGLWGVEVKSLDSGRVLFEHNARTLVMPASNMKILTLATAAETLGWNFCFTTTLETGAAVEGGVLKGDLIVRGTGDPTINSRNERAAAVFDEWASALKAAGITRIDGAIVGDDNAFDDQGLGAGWSWDYLQYGYAAPVGALEVNENVARLTVRPGATEGDPAVLELAPGSGLQAVNHAYTGAAKSAVTIDFERRVDQPILIVTGSLAIDAQPATRDVAVVNPTIYFAQSLKDALIARGIDVTGGAVDADDRGDLPAPDARRVLAQSQSPALREIATVLMKVSQNLYAETLLKAAGAAQGGLGTTEGGRVATRALLSSWGIPQSTYVQYDGSGLSRYDYVTADLIVTILARMFGDPRHKDAFVATLPVAGKDGTIASRMKKTRAEGNAIAKTGSIANVRSLSGYVHTRDGETLAFSILANSFTIPAATVNWIADLAVETLANFTRR